ncbi:MAG TPA: GGDEF domain-containing protein [Methylophilus sp.]|nr:GGDEF domain-containing protein [Methylophilus sp.]HQQ33316.1 GGDEF domain-containing protein [Methylophilus sp.]
MAQNIKTILENIIALTSEKDSNALEIALAQTLFKLAAPEKMRMFSANSIDRTKYQDTPIGKPLQADEVSDEMLMILKKCLDTREILSFDHDHPLMLFPLLNAKNHPIAVIAIEAEEDSIDHELTVMVLKIYHNFVALMNENERDTLTGLLNRKTFDQKINDIIARQNNQQFRRSSDNHYPSYLAIFDIDHFKRVNDTFGHLIGDEVLLMFSHMMSNSFRSEDLLFRFGGEEFVGVFQCPSDETMQFVLDSFRQAVERHDFPQVGKLSASCGFTRIEQFDLAPNMLERADKALYYAKNNGRNQVCQYDELISHGLLETDNKTGDVELF